MEIIISPISQIFYEYELRFISIRENDEWLVRVAIEIMAKYTALQPAVNKIIVIVVDIFATAYR